MPEPSVLTFPARVDARTEMELFRRQLPSSGRVLDEEDLKAFRDYVLGREGSWVLGPSVLPLIQQMLANDEVVLAPCPCRLRLLRLLSHCSLKRDFAKAVVTADSRRRVIMRHAARMATLHADEQLALALFLVHTASHGEVRGNHCLCMLLNECCFREGTPCCTFLLGGRSRQSAIRPPHPALMTTTQPRLLWPLQTLLLRTPPSRLGPRVTASTQPARLYANLA